MKYIYKWILTLSILSNIILVISYLRLQNKIEIEHSSLEELVGEHKNINKWRKIEIIGDTRKNNLPKEGCIPDNKTAIQIAEIVWLNMFGKEIYIEKPFDTFLIKDSLWVVSGTIEDDALGGTFYIELLKKNGQILTVTRQK